MSAKVTYVGFAPEDVMAIAQGQPSGSQKARYSQEVSGYIGANPDLIIRVGGVVKYRAGITGTLGHSASGVALPTQFSEPPDTNVADALTSPDCVLEIRSTVTPTRALQMPLALLSEDDSTRIAISTALDGTKAARASVITLVPPSVLDPQVADGSILSMSDPSLSLVEGWIRDMTMADQGVSSRYSGGSWTNQPGQAMVASASGLTAMTSSPGEGDIMTYGEGLDSLTTWHWVDLASGHGGGDSNVLQCARSEAWVLSSANAWTKLWGPTVPGSGGARWQNSKYSNGGGVIGPADANGIAAWTVGRNENDLANYAIENWPIGFTPSRNPTLMQGAKCWHVRCLVRVAKRTSSGPDNRQLARFRIKVGVDLFNTQHPHFPARGSNNAISNPYKRPEQGNSWPGYAMDGFMCSWHVVPFNPANPDAWYCIGATSFSPQYWVAGGIWDHIATRFGIAGFSDPSPFAQPPHAISHATFRANPPPMPSF